MRRLIAFLTLLSTGCASMVGGRSEQIEVTSSPSGAEVRLLCHGELVDQGITPASLRLRRSAEGCRFHLRRQGYAETTIPLRRRVSSTVWLNLVPGILLGVGAGVAFTLNTNTLGEEDRTAAAQLGGLVIGTGTGLLIDRATGAWFEHDPEEIDVLLDPERR